MGEREPAKVLADVLDKVISLQAARETYKAVIDAPTISIDCWGTRALRRAH